MKIKKFIILKNKNFKNQKLKKIIKTNFKIFKNKNFKNQKLKILKIQKSINKI